MHTERMGLTMYSGRRDPEVRIVVPKAKCSKYLSKTHMKWIEIAVPPESIADYSSEWGTIMVQPEQVTTLDKESKDNIIRVNDGAAIQYSVKDANHVVIASENLTPVEIIGRYLKYYRYETFKNEDDVIDAIDTPSIDNYNDMAALGQNMLYYMNRLPKFISASSYEDVADESATTGAMACNSDDKAQEKE